MKNSDRPAYPIDGVDTGDCDGLTKREYAAIHLMAAIISNADTMREFTREATRRHKEEEFFNIVAKTGFLYADAALEISEGGDDNDV